MFWNPTYDGNPIFGLAVRMRMLPNPTANQVSEFFGVEGVFNLFGGGRGRTFLIDGVLWGEDIPSLNAAEGVMLSYADGIGRLLVDTRGNSWPNVVYDGIFEPDDQGPRPLVGAFNGDGEPYWALRYRAVFRGVT